MSKLAFLQQLSMYDSIDAIDEYEDVHYKNFRDVVFDHLLKPVRHIPYDGIIRNDLQYNECVYKKGEAHSLSWLYRADRRVVDSITIYSFRFANACHPDLYQSFGVHGRSLFKPVSKPRHKYSGWYEYTGADDEDELGRYLNIRRVTQDDIPHTTKLFINQEQERLDIQFRFPSINERIAICFESGYPAYE